MADKKMQAGRYAAILVPPRAVHRTAQGSTDHPRKGDRAAIKRGLIWLSRSEEYKEGIGALHRSPRAGFFTQAARHGPYRHGPRLTGTGPQPPWLSDSQGATPPHPYLRVPSGRREDGEGAIFEAEAPAGILSVRLSAPELRTWGRPPRAGTYGDRERCSFFGFGICSFVACDPFVSRYLSRPWSKTRTQSIGATNEDSNLGEKERKKGIPVFGARSARLDHGSSCGSSPVGQGLRALTQIVTVPSAGALDTR
ncbi:hypothetical protein GGTG_13347 [Gaeumannomyces tritici R3-111a-1]|uniref:Uncharacterized protein n=1 Tax=Gaeumannomyces tritici (strain R3-111a-1) TaxID=644352 RepID=J3PIL8_GAET3|nr:hypothetical protein GGTG_13347 [Gaeumannomyces tritici R3-111a-1]EJT69079.1 hypothetical protein GGTG_13347 [Gaeumannomyces tritici R3-111a-1]